MTVSSADTACAAPRAAFCVRLSVEILWAFGVRWDRLQPSPIMPNWGGAALPRMGRDEEDAAAAGGRKPERFQTACPRPRSSSRSSATEHRPSVRMGRHRTSNTGVSIYKADDQHVVDKKKRKQRDISIFDHVQRKEHDASTAEASTNAATAMRATAAATATPAITTATTEAKTRATRATIMIPTTRANARALSPATLCFWTRQATCPNTSPMHRTP